MKRTHLPLNGLRVLDAAARHLSFTRAADELAVTPAAVGQQIRALEEMLGVVLFRRTPKGLELTDEAGAGLDALRGAEAADAFDELGRLAAPLRYGRAALPGHAHQVGVLPLHRTHDFGKAILQGRHGRI